MKKILISLIVLFISFGNKLVADTTNSMKQINEGKEDA